MSRFSHLGLAAALLMRVPPQPRATVHELMPEPIEPPTPAQQVAGPMPIGLRDDPDLWNREVDRRRMEKLRLKLGPLHGRKP
jgi:hypothetical protein